MPQHAALAGLEIAGVTADSRQVAPGGRDGCSGMYSAWLIAGASWMSGSIPSMGPIRAITRPAAGAATQPAVE